MAKIKLDTNVPVEVRLKSLTAELVDSQFGGQEYRFDCAEGSIYVKEAAGTQLHEQIRRLKIVVNEPVEICKREVVRAGGRKGIVHEVARVGFAPDEIPAAEPVAPVRRVTSAEVLSSEAPAWAKALAAQTRQLIDVYADAVSYASAKHGNAVKPEDVRSMMTTLFINLSKGGNTRAA